MESAKKIEYIFDFLLIHFIGLYQILDPDTTQDCGHNKYYVFNMLSSLYLLVICALCPVGLYYLSNDLNAFSVYFGCVQIYLLMVYKVIIFMYYSDDIRKCADIARLGFMASYKHYNKEIFNKWHILFKRISYTYFIFVTLLFIAWILCPYVLNETTYKIKNIDGSYSEFRLNIHNFYLIVSDQTYNEYYSVVYAIEVVALFLCVNFLLMTTLLLVGMCFGFSCQLETINDAIRILGHDQCLTGNDDGKYVDLNVI